VLSEERRSNYTRYIGSLRASNCYGFRTLYDGRADDLFGRSGEAYGLAWGQYDDLGAGQIW